MKWIKLWENFRDEGSLIEGLDDLLEELRDEGMRTECKHDVPSRKYAPLPGQREHISVGIEQSAVVETPLTFADIEEVVFRMINWMDDKGWKASYITFEGETYNIENEEALKWIERNFKPEYWIWGLTINFIRK